MIDKAQWLKAQWEERNFHKLSLSEGIQTYWRTYFHLFQYTGVTYTQVANSILEIGPAEFPGLFYVRDFVNSYIIEPMPCTKLPHLAQEIGVTLIKKPAEEVEFPKVHEVWLFNVLTHTMDPDLIIEKAKKCCRIIRYFEPINQEINDSHFWMFPQAYFEHHFPGSVNYYPANQSIPGFHEHECVYGVFNTGNHV